MESLELKVAFVKLRNDSKFGEKNHFMQSSFRTFVFLAMRVVFA